MTTPNLLGFSMRTEPPKAGEDWFRIVKAKKGEKSTKVYIYDEIGYWGTTAKDFAALLDDIDTDEIELHINSPGGSVFDGVAIYNSLKQHPAKVIGQVDGLAASAASFILQSADERVSTRNAQIMIHDAKAYAGGNAEAMRKAAILLDTVSDNIADIYSQRGVYDQKKYRDLMKAETWYLAKEAKEAGLVDTVTDIDEDDAEDAKDKWDLQSMFNYAGREFAPPPVSVLNSIVINGPSKEDSVVTQSGNNSTITLPVDSGNPQASKVEAPLFKMTVNGSEVNDLDTVQAHINSLEAFKKETIEGGRKSFVQSLADGPSPKIAATQISDMEDFALSLSNEQFAKWKASMEAAPAASLFGQYGNPSSTQPVSQETAQQKERNAKIATLQEIVDSHLASGMSQAEVEKKQSWTELQKLKSANTQ